MELAIAIVISILQNVDKLPNVIGAISAMFDGEKTPTPEEIRALKITKDPSEYFKEE